MKMVVVGSLNADCGRYRIARPIHDPTHRDLALKPGVPVFLETLEVVLTGIFHFEAALTRNHQTQEMNYAHCNPRRDCRQS